MYNSCLGYVNSFSFNQAEACERKLVSLWNLKVPDYQKCFDTYNSSRVHQIKIRYTRGLGHSRTVKFKKSYFEKSIFTPDQVELESTPLIIRAIFMYQESNPHSLINLQYLHIPLRPHSLPDCHPRVGTCLGPACQNPRLELRGLPDII